MQLLTVVLGCGTVVYLWVVKWLRNHNHQEKDVFKTNWCHLSLKEHVAGKSGRRTNLWSRRKTNGDDGTAWCWSTESLMLSIFTSQLEHSCSKFQMSPVTNSRTDQLAVMLCCWEGNSKLWKRFILPPTSLSSCSSRLARDLGSILCHCICITGLCFTCNTTFWWAEPF